MCGLAAALLCAATVMRRTVLERDPGPLPDSPENAWEHRRDGVTQFR